MSDPRGFKYGLQVLLQRAQWQLDALQCALADALRRQQEAQAALARLREEQHAVRTGAAAAGQRFDPLHARAIVQHLCQLAERVQQQSGRCDDAERACALKRRECAEAQARLEGLQAHRDRALATHRQVQLRKESALADEQWTTHTTTTTGGLPMASEST